MTKRTAATLLIFGTALLVVLIGIGWISKAALELVDREALARRQAALEENVRLALWRMDSALAPLIANESARPYFMYAAFYPAGRAYDRMFAEPGESEPLVPSPLLDESIEHVLLHFQVDARGEITSPSVPRGRHRQLALARALSEEDLTLKEQRLAELKSLLENEDLNARLATSEKPVIVAKKDVAQAASTPRGKSSLEWSARQQQVLNVQSYNNPEASGEGAFDGNIGRNAYRNTGALTKNRAFVAGEIRQGPLTPIWVKGALLLARRVRLGDADYVQGVWLDWSSVREWLLSTVRDLLPDAELRAVERAGEPEERRLASVPAHVIATRLPIEPEAIGTPVRWVLGIAWSGFLIAAAAVAMLLFGTLALSERRAAFVSAVTHELRTPLTTFRMYSEMLAEGMVADETKKAHYLDTLKKEAVRLTHLVENVLAYARIERGRHTGRIETLPIAETIDRFADRLRDRAAQAGMQVEIKKPEQPMSVRADATAVEQILFNLVDNACKYAAHSAEKSIDIAMEPRGHRVVIHVRDHGPGITGAAKKRLFAPFSRSAEAAAGSAPGVGLGLALSRRLARTMGGDLSLDDASQGASFSLSLPSA